MTGLSLIETQGAVSLSECAGGGAASAAPEPLFLILPAPPSVNHAYRNTKSGRAKSKHFVDWCGLAGWKLREQGFHRVPGPVVIMIGVERTSAVADIDNRIKPLLDFLVERKVIDDDKHVIGIAAAWSPPRDALVRVAIIPAGDLSVRFQLADPAHGGFFLEQSPIPTPALPSRAHGKQVSFAPVTEEFADNGD